MGTPRFFCEQLAAPGATLALPDTVAHHIRVRRLKAGQPIVLFDGSGVQAHAALQFERGGQAIASVASIETVDRELPWALTLIQGVASQDRMDWIVEKAVELGVSTLVPVLTERSVVKLNSQRADKRVQHWQKLVISASEQCGRNRLMQIHMPCDTATAIRLCAGQPMLWCHLHGQSTEISSPSIVEQVALARQACLVVGPEGGFSDGEVRAWQQAGAQSVRLGTRVLRTETAGVVAVAGLTALLQAREPVHATH